MKFAGLFILLVASGATTAYLVHPLASKCHVHQGCRKPHDPECTIHLPHETDCHKFYKCVGSRACELECPMSNDGEERLVYNPELEVCDWPLNVNVTCNDIISTSTTPQTITTTTLEPTDTTPGPTSTTPEPSTTTTPQPITSTTPEPSTSTTPQPITTTTPEPTSTTPQPITSTTPEPTSTTPQPITSTTPEPSTSTTPQPITSTTPEPTTTTPQPITSTTPEPTSTTPEPTTTTAQPITSTTLKPSRHSCPAIGNARVPDDYDCTAYYICKDGKRSEIMYCQENHVFNPVTEACDLPMNTDCTPL